MGDPGVGFARNLAEYGDRKGTTGPYADNLDVDVLIVGAGFGGVFMLKTLRERGLRVVVYEAGESLGGTWRWNCYPGARVDSRVPEYEFSWPEVYKDWTWSTNYPDFRELRAYFDHVDRVLDIKKDCAFATVVVEAQFNLAEGKWNVKTADGRLARSKYLVSATGFAANRYIPKWPGLDKFKGTVHHSSFWPDQDVDVTNKRCAVIGTGASGVQITQEWASKAGSLKVFQRTPNLALPMRRRDLTAEEQNRVKEWGYPFTMQLREKTPVAFTIGTFSERLTFEDTPEEREAAYAEMFREGGFHFWASNYRDLLTNAEANKEAYAFWTRSVRARIRDPRKRDLLAPLEMPHYFGVKRPCLEQDLYEQYNRENVDVVDIRNNAIAGFTETGIQLEDGTHYEVDVVAIATGFDVSTGSMTQMGLRSIHDTWLRDEWKDAATTYLGLTVSGYPNMFHIYSVQAPTLLSNGPTLVEIQGRWIGDCIRKMERGGVRYIDAKPEASRAWKKQIDDLSNATLFPTVRSTFMGGSVPGKPFEQTNYVGGIPRYAGEIRMALDSWEEGFKIVRDEVAGKV